MGVVIHLIRDGTADRETWDEYRREGDRSFATHVETTWRDDTIDADPAWDSAGWIRTYRPRRAVASRRWIMESGEVPEASQPRLLRLLEALEANSTLSVEISH